MMPITTQPEVARFAPEVTDLGDAIRNKSRLQILERLETGPARFTELMGLTGKKPGALSPHLKKLQWAGLIRKVSRVHGDEIQERYEMTTFGDKFLVYLDRLYGPSSAQRHESDTSVAGVLQVPPTTAERSYTTTQASGDIVVP